MFHDADQGRFGTPRNAFDLLSNHNFEEMLWENNTLVMRRRNNKAQHGGDPVLGFTPFFEYQDQSVNDVNARAVPEDHHDTARTTSVFMSNKDNYVPRTTNCNNNPLFGSGFGSENIADPSSYVRSSKRSAEDWNNNNPTTIRKLDNKKLKATVDDHQPNNDFIAPQGDSLVPDEFPLPNVAAVARKAIESGDCLVPGPGTSIAASNDALPPWTMGTIYEEFDDYSEYPDSEEDREQRARRTPQSHSSSLHSRSEKKRRDRINKKMRALQVLLPNCNNRVDMASVLDEAIEYVKTLQFQLQLLSAGGSHMFPSPMMMMPPLPQIPMNQFVGMGFAMGPGFGHQFSMSGFHGFMPCFPFMPWPSPRSEMPGPAIVPDVSGTTTTTSIDQIGSNYSGYPKEFLRPRDE